MENINRLLTGIIMLEVEGKTIFVRPYQPEVRLMADKIASDVYDDCLLDGVYTREEISELLIKMGWWSQEEEMEISSFEKKIEQAKVDYFNGFAIKEKVKHIKYNLKLFEDRLSELVTKKNAYGDKSCEYVSDYAKLSYLLENSSYIDNKELITGVNIIRLVTEFNENSLSEKDIRKVAKSHEWKNYWNAAKISTGLFKVSASELTIEQASLVSWSHFYENIYESTDCPSDEVIEDDIALDGWVISQSRKRKEEQKKRDAEKLLPQNAKDAGEIFVPVRNKQEQEQVLLLNDGYGKAVLAQTNRDLQDRGHVNEMDLTHVRQTINMEMNKRR